VTTPPAAQARADTLTVMYRGSMVQTVTRYRTTPISGRQPRRAGERHSVDTIREAESGGGKQS